MQNIWPHPPGKTVRRPKTPTTPRVTSTVPHRTIASTDTQPRHKTSSPQVVRSRDGPHTGHSSYPPTFRWRASEVSLSGKWRLRPLNHPACATSNARRLLLCNPIRRLSASRHEFLLLFSCITVSVFSLSLLSSAHRTSRQAEGPLHSPNRKHHELGYLVLRRYRCTCRLYSQGQTCPIHSRTRSTTHSPGHRGCVYPVNCAIGPVHSRTRSITHSPGHRGCVPSELCDRVCPSAPKFPISFALSCYPPASGPDRVAYPCCRRR
jgi:hypothetical protein